MYHVIATGVTAILLYLISYIFYRIGYYSLLFHKRFWNLLLAIAFIITCMAGIFMALQINYKWNIPIVKSIVKWHAEFGIGMAFTGLFHFIWHLSYFKKVFEKQESLIEKEISPEVSKGEISTNLFIVGFVSSSFQLLLLREMMNISGGYELITGIFLGSWLISSAIGSYLAGRSLLNDIRKINLIFSISPLVSLLLLLLLSRLLLKTGESPSFLLSIIYTLLVLTPFCLVSGFTFIKLISFARSAHGFVPGRSFSIETTGGIASGILISILTSGILNTYQLMLLIVILSSAYVAFTFFPGSTGTKIIAKIIVVILVVCIIVFKPDIFFRQILLPGIKITSTEDTPYGNISEGIYQNERSVYYDQRLLSHNDDVIEREENIHYSMLQRESPEKVILVSGSLTSHLPEILKYPVRKLIYIERDPALARAQIIPENTFEKELIIANTDAFRYIKKSSEVVDVIILLIPPPTTLLLNRYYTTEFFSLAKKRLKTGGVFMCSPGPGDDYFNKELLNLYSSINNSLASVFKYVRPVVGNKLYFIASDTELSVSFCELSEVRDIKNIYVSSDYLADDLITQKSTDVMSLFDRGIKQNRYAYPIASFYFQAFSFSKYIGEKRLVIALMVIVFALPVLTIKRRYFLMYFSASALAGFEIIILLSLQLIFGNLYHLAGLVIAGLMTGLAVGASSDIKFFNTLSLRIKALILLIFYILGAMNHNYFLSMESGLPAIILIIIFSFLPAFLTGHIFRELTIEGEGTSVTSKVYSADLAGSALGFILISGLAVPAFGIRVSILLLASLILAGIVFGTVRNK